MCNSSLLVVLKENVQSLGEKWSELSYLLAEKAADLDKVDEADLAETLDSLAFNPFQVNIFSDLYYSLHCALCNFQMELGLYVYYLIAINRLRLNSILHFYSISITFIILFSLVGGT